MSRAAFGPACGKGGRVPRRHQGDLAHSQAQDGRTPHSCDACPVLRWCGRRGAAPRYPALRANMADGVQKTEQMFWDNNYVVNRR